MPSYHDIARRSIERRKYIVRAVDGRYMTGRARQFGMKASTARIVPTYTKHAWRAARVTEEQARKWCEAFGGQAVKVAD